VQELSNYDGRTAADNPVPEIGRIEGVNLYEDLAPARGIFLAFLASVVIWALIAWAWWG